MQGQVLKGRYQIEGTLGSGGMGVVYQALDKELQRSVALKVLSPDLMSDRKIEQRFHREFEACALLNHPNLCKYYELEKAEDGTCFFTMELVEGRDLRQVLEERVKLPPAEVYSIVSQMASAYEHFHEKGLVHRDIKPANMMVCPDGRLIVMDFGLVRAGFMTRLTVTGEMLGTPRYLSPEHLAGAALDNRSDIFQLGVVVFELLTGQSPFEGGLGSVLDRIRTGRFKPISAVDDSVAPAWERFVMNCMAVDPANRFGDAKQMSAYLAKFKEELDGSVSLDKTKTNESAAGMFEFGPEFRSAYRVERALDCSAFGMIFKARQLSSGRLVAIKYLAHWRDEDRPTKKRLLREAKLLASLKHENIMAVLDCGLDGKVPYLVQELLEGETLEQYLDAKGQLELDEVTSIALQLAQGLAAAHEAGVVHRNLKPDTVYCTTTGDVKLLDFGLARGPLFDVATATSNVVEIPAFKAPETLRKGKVTQASDIYCLGCLLYVMVTGKYPQQMKMGKRAPSVASSANRQVPTQLTQLIDKMVAVSPAQRPAKARDVVKALGGGGEKSTAAKRSPWPLMVAVLVCLLVVVGVVFTPMGEKEPVEFRGLQLRKLDELALRFAGPKEGRARVRVASEEYVVDLSRAVAVSQSVSLLKLPLRLPVAEPCDVEITPLSGVGEPKKLRLSPRPLLDKLLDPIDELDRKQEAYEKLLGELEQKRNELTAARNTYRTQPERYKAERAKAQRSFEERLHWMGLTAKVNKELQSWLSRLLHKESLPNPALARRLLPLWHIERLVSEAGGLAPPWGESMARLNGYEFSNKPRSEEELKSLIRLGMTDFRAPSAKPRGVRLMMDSRAMEQQKRANRQMMGYAFATTVKVLANYKAYDSQTEREPRADHIVERINIPVKLDYPEKEGWQPLSTKLDVVTYMFSRELVIEVRVNNSPPLYLMDTSGIYMNERSLPWISSMLELRTTVPINPKWLRRKDNFVSLKAIRAPGPDPITPLAVSRVEIWCAK